MIRAIVRLAVFIRDEFRCLTCGHHLSGLPGRIQVEYLVPHSQGGYPSSDNLYTSCTLCRTYRKGASLRDYLISDADRLGCIFPGDRDRIERVVHSHCTRSMAPYLTQAREILSGTLES